MADSEASIRQRKGAVAFAVDGNESDDRPVAPKTLSAKKRIAAEDAYGPWFDVLRVLTFLFIASCGLSYLISGGETWFWAMKKPPNYLQFSWWMRQFTPPLILTAAELAAYDGSDPAKPLLLGINGTIYDVSSNQRVYGPDGSYNVFTGVDGGRGYVTGCFGEDRTADMRGAELMFLPLDDPAVDRHWPAAELAALRARERDEALRQVHDKLKHWVDFFAKSKKYHRVGYVKRPTGWPETEGPVRPLCEQAQQQREKRKVPGQEEEPQE